MNNRICIAKIATAHGIKGLVKLHVFSEDPQLADGILFTSESGDTTLSLTLKNATAKHWLAEIDGITDRTQAEKLRGAELYIDRDKLPQTNDDEFYISDLIGMMCVNENNQNIGKVIAVENFGAGDLLEIQPKSAESFYLPMSNETILEILENKIIVDVPEGIMN
jgi:16S rRNA processing protein RimM